MRSLLCILICSLLFFGACSSGKVQTANPEASEEARKLLEFLYEIQGEYVLSGQHNFIAVGTKYTDRIKENTGNYPIVWGSDFSFCYEGEDPIQFQHCGPINLPDPDNLAVFESMQSLDVAFTNLTPGEARWNLVETATAKHKEGFIITLMWHACPPGFGDYCDGKKIWDGQDRMSDSEWNDLTTEGTRLNNAWKVQADTIALYLKQLRDAGVPVLWRPYHEMNGEWFWWGNRKGENGFKKLWVMMYDYFVHHHSLNNLLWVWNPNAPINIPGNTAYSYEEFWPGAEFVDILAANVYGDDWKQSHYDDLTMLADGKPVAVGVSVPPPSMEIFQSQDQWAWFMAWGNRILWGNGIDRIQALSSSGRALTLEDITIENGNYLIHRDHMQPGSP